MDPIVGQRRAFLAALLLISACAAVAPAVGRPAEAALYQRATRPPPGSPGAPRRPDLNPGVDTGNRPAG
jgi:hypothetical protein